MDHKEIIDKIRPELDKVVGFLEKELAKIRTSQASPSLVEDILVECFDQRFSLKQLAAISCPQKREILISPWDKSYLGPIEKALSNSGIGANPIVEKDSIRINLPALNQDYRKNLVLLISEKKEQSRQTVRHWRQDAWKEIQDGFQQGDISEDNKYRAKDELQKLVDEYNKKIEEIGERKKKEIES